MFFVHIEIVQQLLQVDQLLPGRRPRQPAAVSRKDGPAALNEEGIDCSFNCLPQLSRFGDWLIARAVAVASRLPARAVAVARALATRRSAILVDPLRRRRPAGIDRGGRR